MNSSYSTKLKSFINKIASPDIGNNNINTKINSNEENNSSLSILNSVKYLTTYEDSPSDAKKLHIIKNPYKIWIPIKTKMKKIKKKRQSSLNTYYRKEIRNNLILKEILTNDTPKNMKNILNISKEENLKLPSKNYVLKSIFNFSNKNKKNISKNIDFLTTERTSSICNNISNNSYRGNSYNKNNIYSNISIIDNNNNTNIICNTEKKNNTYVDFKAYKFVNMIEGFQDLPSINNGVKHFVFEVKNLTKQKFMNHCLIKKENKRKAYKECNDDNFLIEMKAKKDNKNLFDLFYKDYNTYYNRLKVKMVKDNDYISVLKWNIISYKNEVNRLTIRK